MNLLVCQHVCEAVAAMCWQDDAYLPPHFTSVFKDFWRFLPPYQDVDVVYCECHCWYSRTFVCMIKKPRLNAFFTWNQLICSNILCWIVLWQLSNIYGKSAWHVVLQWGLAPTAKSPWNGSINMFLDLRKQSAHTRWVSHRAACMWHCPPTGTCSVITPQPNYSIEGISRSLLSSIHSYVSLRFLVQHSRACFLAHCTFEIDFRVPFIRNFVALSARARALPCVVNCNTLVSLQYAVTRHGAEKLLLALRPLHQVQNSQVAWMHTLATNSCCSPSF